jgi:D-3-phosphoglycerate dehydrogenase
MIRVLAMEGLTERGRELLTAEGWQVDLEKACPPEALAKLIVPYDAVLVRSGSRITAEVLDAAKNLRVIGRPGVGVDNVDVEAATRRGIVVMNSPKGNMVSTAELAMALLLAVARNIAQADASIKAQRWDRKSFAGVELNEKQMGIVGLGRIGREVAARCQAMGMSVVGYDPFVAASVAEAHGVRLVDLDELFKTSDFISLHTHLNDETRHMIGRESLAKVKPGVRIVNAARGALIDDDALLEALESGRVAGAALDVHSKEPPVNWKLATHPRVVATPHVGASTKEAQERVGTDIAIQVRDYLKGGVIQQAVNFFSFSSEFFDNVRPGLELAERLGRFLSQACPGKLKRVEMGLYGELSELDITPIISAALSGILRPLEGPHVSYVNAAAIAKEKGIEVVESRSAAPLAFSNLMAMRLVTSEGEMSASGTLFGRGHLRLVEIDGVEIDAIPRGHLLFIRNEDRPGVIGHMGTLAGERGVNIARMTVGRRPDSRKAMMVLEVDDEVPAEAIEKLHDVPGVTEVRAIAMDD